MLLVTQNNFSNGKNVTMDVNLRDLMYVYAAYRGKIKDKNLANLKNGHHSSVVVFHPSRRNGKKRHAIDLDEIIFNFYQQRYLPYELIKETRVVLVNENNFSYFKILDKDGVTIADIVDNKTFEKYNIDKDEKGQFSVTSFKYDFTKRR